MTNALDYLFEKYSFSKRDRHDTLQIFSLLSEEKQKNFVAHFEAYAEDLQKLESDLEIEKSILIGNAVEQVKTALLNKRKQKLERDIQKTLHKNKK